MIKTAVVTGFSGFIGTTFTMQLLKRGWKVYGIDKFTHVSNRKLTAQKQENFNFENKDIRQIKWLPECDVIFNFAAESDVDIGNQSCYRFIKSNIDGVRNILDILGSYWQIAKRNPLFFINKIYDEKNNSEMLFEHTEEKADIVMEKNGYVHTVLYSIKNLLKSKFKNYIFIDYDDLLNNPKETLDKMAREIDPQ